ncbi:hypothetical protein HZB88_02710 [archaeon]|nr:hypothetical protein [archaeon]
MEKYFGKIIQYGLTTLFLVSCGTTATNIEHKRVFSPKLSYEPINEHRGIVVGKPLEEKLETYLVQVKDPWDGTIKKTDESEITPLSNDLVYISPVPEPRCPDWPCPQPYIPVIPVPPPCSGPICDYFSSKSESQLAQYCPKGICPVPPYPSPTFPLPSPIDKIHGPFAGEFDFSYHKAKPKSREPMPSDLGPTNSGPEWDITKEEKVILPTIAQYSAPKGPNSVMTSYDGSGGGKPGLPSPMRIGPGRP